VKLSGNLNNARVNSLWIRNSKRMLVIRSRAVTNINVIRENISVEPAAFYTGA